MLGGGSHRLPPILIMPRKAELENKYDVPVYSQWRCVPAHLHARKWFENVGVKIAKNEPPDAIKGGGMYSKTIYFLFDERKYLSAEKLHAIAMERKPVI